MRADLRRLIYIYVCRLINRFSMSSAMSSIRICHVIAIERLYKYVCLSVYLFFSSSLFIYISIFFILFFIFLRDLMDPVIIVYGNWIKKIDMYSTPTWRICKVRTRWLQIEWIENNRLNSQQQICIQRTTLHQFTENKDDEMNRNDRARETMKRIGFKCFVLRLGFGF